MWGERKKTESDVSRKSNFNFYSRNALKKRIAGLSGTGRWKAQRIEAELEI